MSFARLFPAKKPLIGVIHLPALPGAPLYKGDMEAIYQRSVKEALIFDRSGVDALIVENFGDAPFFPEQVPPATVAAMGGICREIARQISIPLGVNVLRNDGAAALSIAEASGADFIRINVHIGAVVADQGLIQGKAHEVLRLRRLLGSQALIFADVGVKHASPLAGTGLLQETRDLSERGMADAVIVSGSGTGHPTSIQDLKTVKENSALPVLIGSGTSLQNLAQLNQYADGYIVGSAFKEEGRAQKPVSETAVEHFVKGYQSII